MDLKKKGRELLLNFEMEGVLYLDERKGGIAREKFAKIRRFLKRKCWKQEDIKK